jgi:hypothetical protein
MIVNNQHTVTVEQSAVRLVTCEECNAEYVYTLSRSGEGIGNSVYFLDESGAKKRAERKAKEQLSRKMKSACEPIPCPKCLHIQDHMIGKARSDRGAGISFFAIVAFLLALGGCALGQWTKMGNAGFILGGVFFLFALGLGALALIAFTSYDPNKQSEETLRKIADENAFLRKEFERSFAATAADEFERFCKKLGKKKGRRFEMAVWADRGQVRDAEALKVKLPVGETATIKLREARDSDEFAFPQTVDDYDIEIVCVLNVYTKTKLQD